MQQERLCLAQHLQLCLAISTHANHTLFLSTIINPNIFKVSGQHDGQYEVIAIHTKLTTRAVRRDIRTGLYRLSRASLHRRSVQPAVLHAGHAHNPQPIRCSILQRFDVHLCREGLCRRWADLLSPQHFNLISRFVVSESCASASQQAELTTQQDMQRFQMNTFRMMMQYFGRYSNGLGFTANFPFPTDLTFTDYRPEPHVIERWARQHLVEGMLFTKVDESE